VIAPAVERVGLLDWNQLRQVRDAGRKTVQEPLDRDPGALRACL
jgi:hypothetical protein